MDDLNDPKSLGSKKSKRSRSGNGCGCFRCFGRLCACLRASPSPDVLRTDLDGSSLAPSVVLDEGSTSLRTPGAGQLFSRDVAVQAENLDFDCLVLEDSDDEDQVESLSDSLTSSSPQPSNAVVVRARDSSTSVPDQPYQPYGPWAERVGQGENHHFYYEGVPPKDKRPRTAPLKGSEGGEVSVEGDSRKRPSSAPTATKFSRTSERALRNPVSRKVKVTAL